MSEKAAIRGDTDIDIAGHISLEQGLDIVINCEVNQKDPAGITAPYRLLVPALWYEGRGDPNREDYRKKNVLQRLATIGSQGRKREPSLAASQGQGNWGKSESETESEGGVDEAAIGQRRDWYGGQNGVMPERNLTQRHRLDLGINGAAGRSSGKSGTPRQQQQRRNDYEDTDPDFLGGNVPSSASPATVSQGRGDHSGDLQRYPSASVHQQT